jgi:hypothetical protein
MTKFLSLTVPPKNERRKHPRYKTNKNILFFRIYLPACTDPPVDTLPEKTEEISPSCSETVLVVEEETAPLKMSKRVLVELGNRVLAAGTPREAFPFGQA